MLRIKTLLDILCYTVVLLGLAPLFPWLEGWVAVGTAVAFAAGIVCDRHRHYWINPALATILTLIFFGIFAIRIDLNNVVVPVVNVLALLLGIRMLTPKQGRHYLQIFVLALFCLAASSLLSLNMLYLPALILLMFNVTIGLVLLTFFQRNPGLHLKRTQAAILLKSAAVIPAGSLVLMLVLFFILPRTQYPLWDFLNSQPSASTGFSEEVRPGTFAANNANEEVAFRAECAELAPEHLYWRGTVLDTISGSTWERGAANIPAAYVAGGTRVECNISLPANNRRFLFSLDYPLELQGVRHESSNDLVAKTRRPLNKGISYTCISAPGGELRSEGDIALSQYLQLPQQISARVREVAEDIRARADSALERIDLLKEFFRNRELTYATTDLPRSTAPVDEFLFQSRRGYCEFFASSFALLLRLCDVPARLVGGYHGGDYNNFGDYYLISENMAHVWVEALVGDSWIRIDPSALASNAASGMGAQRQGLSLWQHAMDGLEFWWSQAVITYDLNKQLSLVRKGSRGASSLLSRLSAPSAAELLYPALGIGVIFLSGAVLVAWIRRARLTPQQRLLQRYKAILRKRYKVEQIPVSKGLLEHAQELNDSDCITFIRQLNAGIYGTKPMSQAQYAHLQALLDRIENPENS